MSKWLKDVWKNISMSPAERYLSKAVDHKDLEIRLDNLRFGRVKFY